MALIPTYRGRVAAIEPATENPPNWPNRTPPYYKSRVKLAEMERGYFNEGYKPDPDPDHWLWSQAAPEDLPFQVGDKIETQAFGIGPGASEVEGFRRVKL